MPELDELDELLGRLTDRIKALEAQVAELRGLETPGADPAFDTLRAGNLTSGRVVLAGTGGLLTDDADLAFNGTQLALATQGNTGGILIGGDAQLYRGAADQLRTPDSLVVDANLSAGTLSTSGSVTVGQQDVDDATLTLNRRGSGTTDTVGALFVQRHSSDTPAAGFGVGIRFNLESSTTAARNAGFITVSWATATDASRAGRVNFSASDSSADRQFLRGETNGSAPMIGFLGANAITRPAVTGSRGGNAALASLLTALANLGLITDSST